MNEENKKKQHSEEDEILIDNSDNSDEEFDSAWNNLNSRRQCERTHRKHKMTNFKKKFEL